MLEIGIDKLMAVALVTGLLIIRIGELRVHRYQKKFLEDMGSKEVGRGWMIAYYALEGVALGVMCVELLVLPKHELPIWQRLLGLIMLGAGGALRLWARRSIGRTWSLLLVYVPEIPLVRGGPYRYFRHPEYLSRYLELLGFSAFFGSYYGFGIYLAGTMMVLPQILLLEKRQLSQHAGPPEE